MAKCIVIIFPVFNCIRYFIEYFPTIIRSIEGCADQFKNNYKFEFVVIDDASSDNTIEYLGENYPFIHVLNGNGSLWWSGCCNKGIEYSFRNLKVDYILLWNIDTLPAEDYFNTLLSILTTLKQNEIVGSKVFFKGENKIWSFGGIWNPKTGALSHNAYGEIDSDEYRKDFIADWNCGMGTLLPARLIEDIGYFDSKHFPQYFGDSDYFIRAKDKGYIIKISPKLIIWNDVTNTGLHHNLMFKKYWMSLFSVKSVHNILIRGKFYKRHLSSIKGWLTYIYIILEYTARFFKDYIKSKLSLSGLLKKS